MKRRFDIYHQLMQLDPKDDCQQMVYLVGSYEYPWLNKKALEFALFRTYAVPQISQLLNQTGEFHRRGQKRYDDTSLIIAEITENGYDSERGRNAIRLMNRMHRQYDITNEAMLYVLSTFIFEPIRWNTRYGWRTPTMHENLANYYFWVEVGVRMGIKDIPDSIEAYEQFNIDFEREHFVYDPANQAVANQTIKIMQGWYPAPLAPVVRQAVYAMLDEPLRKAFGFPKGKPWLTWTADKGLKLVAKILRYMPPRLEPFSLTAQHNRTYPDGYQLDDLGTTSHKTG